MSDKNSMKSEQVKPAKGTAYFAVSLFMLLVIVGGVLLVHQQAQQAAVRRAAVARQQANEELGVPRDYPADVVPVYEGLTILETERGTAKSNLGEPMDKWVIHGEIDSEKEPVKEFYHDLMIESGFSQTQYVGLPTGYGMDYASEEYVIQLVIEFRGESELLQVDITVYRVRE